MNTKTLDHRTAQPAQPPEPGLAERRLLLLQELITLEQTGANPSRLKQLCVELKADWLARINEVLAEHNRREQLHLVEDVNICAEFSRRGTRDLARRDLTFGELRFITQALIRNGHAGESVLLALKEPHELKKKRKPKLPSW